MECLLPYLCMVTVPIVMVRLERMLDNRGVGLAGFHCIMYTLIPCTRKSTMYPLTLIYVCVSLLSVMCMYILYYMSSVCYYSRRIYIWSNTEHL